MLDFPYNRKGGSLGYQDLNSALTKIHDLEVTVKNLMRITAKHLYGMVQGTMVKHKENGRLGQVSGFDAEEALVRWEGEPFCSRVCYGDLDIVFQETKDSASGGTLLPLLPREEVYKIFKARSDAIQRGEE